MKHDNGYSASLEPNWDEIVKQKEKEQLEQVNEHPDFVKELLRRKNK